MVINWSKYQGCHQCFFLGQGSNTAFIKTAQPYKFPSEVLKLHNFKVNRQFSYYSNSTLKLDAALDHHSGY